MQRALSAIDRRTWWILAAFAALALYLVSRDWHSAGALAPFLLVGQVAEIPTPAVNPPETQMVPFRRATTERVEILQQESALLTAGTQKFERAVEGTGYIFAITLDVQAVTAGNAATVAMAEDAPFSSLDTIVFKDVNGELMNLGGFDAFIGEVAMAQYRVTGLEKFTTGITNLGTAGAGATGGSYKYQLRLPIALDRRTLRGILANQDRAQKYSLRLDYAGSAAIYATAPTTLPTQTVDKYYEYYTVPQPKAPNGSPQEVMPSDFGLMHFLTATNSETLPAASSTLNHYLRRVGNTVRFIVLILRAGNGTTPRATADATPPSNIRLKVGEDTLFNETYRYRRGLMARRYGYELPSGILVYDAIHDFQGEQAGGELGDDWYYTQALVNGQFIINWSSAFTASSSLRLVTSDMIYVPPKVAA